MQAWYYVLNESYMHPKSICMARVSNKGNTRDANVPLMIIKIPNRRLRIYEGSKSLLQPNEIKSNQAIPRLGLVPIYGPDSKYLKHLPSGRETAGLCFGF